MRDEFRGPTGRRVFRFMRTAMLGFLRNSRVRSRKSCNHQNEEVPRTQRALSAINE